MRGPQIRTLVSGTGLMAALVIALVMPLGYFAQGCIHLTETLKLKSAVSALRIAKHAQANENAWRFQTARLAEMIELPNGGDADVRQRIVHADGQLILQGENHALAAPLTWLRQPIIVRGEIEAWLEMETSLRPIMVDTAWVGVTSISLGLLAWLAVRLFPLRVLDQTLARLSMQSVRFQAALDNMAQGLCLFDARNRLVVHNQRFAEMFGVPPAGVTASTLLAGSRMGDLFSPPDPEQPDGPDSGTHELPDGRAIQVSRQSIPGQGWVATYEDVTERRRSRDQLWHMARHDALTGLPNRVKFREHMEQVLLHARRGSGVAVLYLDLDGFKGVNDSLGHSVGDALLRLVAARLHDCTREMDLVARLGGDEFAIVQADAQQPCEATALADRLVERLQEPFEIDGHYVLIGTSIGIALADATTTAEGLLHNADTALYRAKAGGRGTARFFEATMDAEMRARRRLESDLRQALAQEQFELFYQPLIEAKAEVLLGFEALLRWNHPERGMVAPAEFIPLAEETGLIRDIGAWVIGRACADAAAWPVHVKVAVNLSSVQFLRGNLVDEVEQALTQSGLAPNRLELEITESVLLQDNDATLGILHRLRDLGVRISMDDFGTGYSSLSYLRRFPFDKIKIDQSFVRNLATEKGSVEIIRAVVGLGQALSMEVLAEGVETVEQLRILQAEGCDELQGYLFSQPKPLQGVRTIIAQFHDATGNDPTERPVYSPCLTLVASEG